MQKWLNYAEGFGTTSKALTDCHTSTSNAPCRAVFYFDSQYKYVHTDGTHADPWYAVAQESWYVHSALAPYTGQRLVMSYSGQNGAIANLNDPGDRAYEQSYVQKFDMYDVAMADDQSSELKSLLYNSSNCGQTPYCVTSQEFTTDAQVVAMRQSFLGSLKHVNGDAFSVVFNGVDTNPSDATPPAIAWQTNGAPLLTTPNVIGGMCEGCPVSPGVASAYHWAPELDAFAAAAADGKAVIMLNVMPSTDTQWIAKRTLIEGFELLGYGGVINFCDCEYDNKNLAVFPEETLVPTLPVQTMGAPVGCPNTKSGDPCTSGGNTSILVAPGVWRREFAQCYIAQVPIGPCAAVVNSTATAVAIDPSWFTASFTHQVTIVGGDVLNGGSLSLSTSAPVSVGPTSAVVLAR